MTNLPVEYMPVEEMNIDEARGLITVMREEMAQKQARFEQRTIRADITREHIHRLDERLRDMIVARERTARELVWFQHLAFPEGKPL